MNKKIYFETYGCAMNQSDSETMQGILASEGYKIVETSDKADCIVINSCIVKAPTLLKIVNRAKEYKKLGKKVVVAGCISQAEPEELKDFSILGTEQINKVSVVVEATLNDQIVKVIERKDDERLNFPKVRKNNIVEIVPISRGCLGNCAYCKVKYARGNLFSYKPEAIVKYIKKAVKEGAKEIWLTSQDNGCYGHDIGTNIIKLTKEILEIKGDFKVRIGMANPNFIKKYLKDLLEIFDNDKMFRYIHIPLQAGSDKVLKDMNRLYTSKDFRKIVKTLRDKFPDITIATDIICGFPTETNDDFQKTLEIVEETKLDVINISKFYSMPGTAARKLKPLDSKIITARTKQMVELFHKIAKHKNNEWVGWEDIVLIDEKGTKDDSWIGRNYAYKPVIVKYKKDSKQGKIELGDMIKVKIKSATKFDLRAEEL